MKLRNRKTGEIVEFRYLQSDYVAPLVLTTYKNDKPEMYSYTSLADLNEEWEDYEEPKEYWYLENNGDIDKETYDGDSYEERMIEIGNYFDTREEAELTVRKLKAWKRLKDKGFKFTGYSHYDWNGNESPAIAFEYSDFGKMFDDKQVVADLDLLFSQEDEE